MNKPSWTFLVAAVVSVLTGLLVLHHFSPNQLYLENIHDGIFGQIDTPNKATQSENEGALLLDSIRDVSENGPTSRALTIDTLSKRPESAQDDGLAILLADYPELQAMTITKRSPGIRLPSMEEVKHVLLDKLKQASVTLEHVFHDAKSTTDEVLKAMSEYIEAHAHLLPEQIKAAIQDFDSFCHAHPYIVLAAATSLSMVAAEFIIAPAAIRLLGLFGFSEIGPVAGSWAAAVQSSLYGGRTGGLFSIIQSITMTAKRVWPIHAFIDLSVLGGVAVLEKEHIRDLAHQWRHEMSTPALRVMVDESAGLTDWMQGIQARCVEAKVPEVQWGDVALQMLYGTLFDLTL